MNEEEPKLEPTNNVPSDKPSTSRPSVRVLKIAATLLLVGVVAIIGYFIWKNQNSEIGRPVPVPRVANIDQVAHADTPGIREEDKVTVSPEMIARSGIKTVVVGEQLNTEITSEKLVNGVVQSNTYRETPLMSLVGGIVRNVKPVLGDNVKKGEVLAQVFSSELAEAQSKYLIALADLDEHHKHHYRETRLVEIGASSREEMEQAVTKLKTAEAEVSAMRQRLQLLGLTPQKIAALDNSSQIASDVFLTSPSTGTIISRSVNPGEVIEANKEIVRIADLSSVWVIAQVFEKDLASVHVGSIATIKSNAYPGRVFRGRVSYVDPRLDQTTRTAQVRIEVTNPGQVLKIGMYVDVAFAVVGGTDVTVAAIPSTAVQFLNNQQVVFVPTNENNVFAMRVVRLGPQVNGFYSVLDGLRVGESVVTEGSFMLRAEWAKTHTGGAGMQM